MIKNYLPTTFQTKEKSIKELIADVFSKQTINSDAKDIQNLSDKSDEAISLNEEFKKIEKCLF